MQIVPRRFYHINTKMSFLWPSENAKIRFLAGALPRTPLGELTTLPRPPSRLKRGHPPHTLPHSAPIHLRPWPCIPPEFQPDLRLCPLAIHLGSRRRPSLLEQLTRLPQVTGSVTKCLTQFYEFSLGPKL